MKTGDIVEMKKPHPCGERRWEIVRTGGDCKLKCLGCGRTVVLLYDELARRVRRNLSEGK